MRHLLPRLLLLPLLISIGACQSLSPDGRGSTVEDPPDRTATSAEYQTLIAQARSLEHKAHRARHEASREKHRAIHIKSGSLLTDLSAHDRAMVSRAERKARAALRDARRYESEARQARLQAARVMAE